MESMFINGVAGTTGVVCPTSVRPRLLDRRGRWVTGGVSADLGAIRTFPATDVAFPSVGALV